MTNDELRDWQKRMGWTQVQVANELGLSVATYKRYLSGDVPKVVELACKYLEISSVIDEGRAIAEFYTLFGYCELP